MMEARDQYTTQNWLILQPLRRVSKLELTINLLQYIKVLQLSWDIQFSDRLAILVRGVPYEAMPELRK